MVTTDRLVTAVMSRGLDYALKVAADLRRAILALDTIDRCTSPWKQDGDDWIRTTWAGDTVLVRVTPHKKNFRAILTIEAGGFGGQGSQHGRVDRARKVLDQNLANLRWEVVAPEE